MKKLCIIILNHRTNSYLICFFIVFYDSSMKNQLIYFLLNIVKTIGIKKFPKRNIKTIAKFCDC